ncbi:MAG: hypothetical protein ABL901_04630 [Hyphomicrobiaceae bacterium]
MIAACQLVRRQAVLGEVREIAELAAFGACHTCRHFRIGSGTGKGMPHHRGLLGGLLSPVDSRVICMVQVPV